MAVTWLSTGNFKTFMPSFLEAQYFHYLGSFYEVIIASAPREAFQMLAATDFRFFLDSGAYSAWSRGSAIDLDEYCAFIKSNIELIEVYASLDVIPGAPGRNATTAEREVAAEESWANYLYMRAEGLDPLPVFHYGEDWRFLERMLAYGCPYIGVGGLVGIPSQMRRHWLDALFTRITDREGMPTVKTHGFGMTAIPLIFRYPWFSVDSTSWIKATANGAVYLPAMVEGEFVFDRTPSTVMVSKASPGQSQDGKHANSFSPAMRAVLDRWLAECGKTYAEVNDNYTHRATCNVVFFRKVSETKALRPFENRVARQKALW